MNSFLELCNSSVFYLIRRSNSSFSISRVYIFYFKIFSSKLCFSRKTEMSLLSWEISTSCWDIWIMNSFVFVSKFFPVSSSYLCNSAYFWLLSRIFTVRSYLSSMMFLNLSSRLIWIFMAYLRRFSFYS